MRVDNFTIATKERLAILAAVAALATPGAALGHSDGDDFASKSRGRTTSPSAILRIVTADQQTSNAAFVFARPMISPVVALSETATRIPFSPTVDPIADFGRTARSGANHLLAEAVRAWADARLTGAHASDRQNRRAAIAAFYAARDYAPLWSENGAWNSAALASLQRLRAAQEDGLDLRDYHTPATTAVRAEDELDLSEGVVAYAAQASGARVDPRKISRLIGMSPALPEPGAVLTSVAAAGAEAGDMLQNFNPRHPGYTALKEKLAELRAAHSGGERMAELQGGFDAPMTSDETPRPRRIADHAPETFVHMEAEITANMERWRWMPRELSATRIEVNIPDFQLALVRDGAVAYRSRVIVGKTTTPTPIFSDAMRFFIVNPYWNVPPSILKNEMLARHGGDLSYLTQRGYDVSYAGGRPVVRQRPGERNALGRIKFIFPNQYSVYMHDTPTRGLFAQSRRAFSHGCVRVDQPFRLAEAVMGPASGWSEERIRGLLGSAERRIDLSQPLPVHIEYFTAFVDENGALQLRDDIYGHSAKVRAELGLTTAMRTNAR